MIDSSICALRLVFFFQWKLFCFNKWKLHLSEKKIASMINVILQIKMQFLNAANLSKLQMEAIKIYNYRYFDHVVTILCIFLAFLFGRLFHEKKFSNLLNMINDAETTKKYIIQEKTRTQQSIKKIQQKKLLLFTLLFIVVAVIGAYCYLLEQTNLNPLLKICALLVGIVFLVWSRLKYLKWKRKSLENKLKKSQLTTQSQIKQILTQIEPQIAQSLKFAFQKEIVDNYKKQQKRECKLSKCANEKQTYQKLYSLYKSIIAQMAKFTWCKICQSQENINVIDLVLQEFDGKLVLYRKLAKDQKFIANTEKSKELINKMLEDWAYLQPKLQYVCKRGCCIKFRLLIDGLKKQNFYSLNELKASLRN